MNFRVFYPCGDATCYETFDRLDQANLAAERRRQELKKWAMKGAADEDAWTKVYVRELTEQERVKYR